jgi:two-component sensor histidine kinase
VAKSRGAQPGNTNALKHGFYSRAFRNLDVNDLDALQATLEGEIAMLRVQMRRALEIINSVEDDSQEPDPNLALKTLSVLGNTASRIASITRIHATIAGGGSQLNTAIIEALHDINKELGLT